jgi:hypothetical protein
VECAIFFSITASARAISPFLPHIVAADRRREHEGKKCAKRTRHDMWQHRVRPCAVLTATSEGLAPYYLAEIRHDLSQTTIDLVQREADAERVSYSEMINRALRQYFVGK